MAIIHIHLMIYFLEWMTSYRISKQVANDNLKKWTTTMQIYSNYSVELLYRFEFFSQYMSEQSNRRSMNRITH